MQQNDKSHMSSLIACIAEKQYYMSLILCIVMIIKIIIKYSIEIAINLVLFCTYNNHILKFHKKKK